MPLQISEIGVHLAIGADDPSPAAPAEAGSGQAGLTLSDADREDIVARCVAEVLRQLRQQQADR